MKSAYRNIFMAHPNSHIATFKNMVFLLNSRWLPEAVERERTVQVRGTINPEL